MIEIGKQKVLAVRRHGKQVFEDDGTPATKLVAAVVQRVTRSAYGHNSRYCRKLIVKLHDDDLITIRPAGLRTEALIVSANIGLLYKSLLAQRLQTEALTKARAKKDGLKATRARRSLAARERRFSKSLREEAAT